MVDLRIALLHFFFSFSLLFLISAVLFGGLEHGTELVFLSRRQVLGEQDVELQQEVTSGVVHHEGREGVVVQDGHALSFEHSGGLRRHDFVRGDFEKGAIERFEFKWRHGQRVQQANVVLVNEVVAFSSVLGVGHGGEQDGQVALKLVSGSVALSREE